MSRKNKTEMYSRAIAFMKENLCKKIHVSDIAQHCGVSSSCLEKVFAQLVQTGVMRKFLDLKLEKAATMLKSGQSVGDIAAYLQFSSTPHLSMAFKKKYGISPIKYKYPGMTETGK